MALLKTIATIFGLVVIVLGFYYYLLAGNLLILFMALIIGFLFVFAAR